MPHPGLRRPTGRADSTRISSHHAPPGFHKADGLGGFHKADGLGGCHKADGVDEAGVHGVAPDLGMSGQFSERMNIKNVANVESQPNQMNKPTKFRDLLEFKIHELTKNVHHGKFTYPHMDIHLGDDVSELNTTNMRLFRPMDVVPEGLSLHCGWLFHNTRDEFEHTCAVLAKQCDPIVRTSDIADALWILDIHYMDGSFDNYDPEAPEPQFNPSESLNPEYVMNEYCINSNVFQELHKAYGMKTTHNVCRVAEALAASTEPYTLGV